MIGAGVTTGVRFVDQCQQQEVAGRGTLGSSSWGYGVYADAVFNNDRDYFWARTDGGHSSNNHTNLVGGGGFHEKRSSSIGIGTGFYVRKSDGMVRFLNTTGSSISWKMVWFKLNTTSLGCLRYTTSSLDFRENSYYGRDYLWSRTSATHHIND